MLCQHKAGVGLFCGVRRGSKGRGEEIGFNVKMPVWICQMFSRILENVPKWNSPPYTTVAFVPRWQLDDLASNSG